MGRIVACYHGHRCGAFSNVRVFGTRVVGRSPQPQARGPTRRQPRPRAGSFRVINAHKRGAFNIVRVFGTRVARRQPQPQARARTKRQPRARVGSCRVIMSSPTTSALATTRRPSPAPLSRPQLMARPPLINHLGGGNRTAARRFLAMTRRARGVGRGGAIVATGYTSGVNPPRVRQVRHGRR